MTQGRHPPLAVAGAAGVALVALVAIAPSTARAQSAGTPVACDGQMISSIQVVTRPPYTPHSGKWWQTPIGIVASLHRTTRPSVIRRFLIVSTGTPCNELRRSESERILRAQPFIAKATVRTLADGRGGVILLVETTDELTPILGLATAGKSPYVTALRLGEGNILGSARYGVVDWRHGIARDSYGFRYIDYQFLGRPFHLDMSGERGDLGTSNWSVDITHPFLTDEQRVAWRTIASDARELFAFERPVDAPVLVGIERRFADVGGIVRVGPPGQLSLFGLSFSSEKDVPYGPPTPTAGVSYDTLLQRFGRRTSARVNAIWGVRSISYEPVQRFDALDGLQDVQRGFEFGTLLGRSLKVLGATDDDIFLATDFYAGVGGPRTFAFIRGEAEGRQNYDTNNWDAIIAGAHAAMYHRIANHHTAVASLDWAGGWKQRVPFQLRLGEIDGGVRGYLASQDAGAIRTVGRLEDRWYLGRVRDQADVGLSFFTDVGRVWVGDAPFGATSPIKIGAGVGLLAAFPPGSRRTWRLDFAAPLSPDQHARWEVRFTIINALRLGGGLEPRDVRFSRARVVPSSVFAWP